MNAAQPQESPGSSRGEEVKAMLRRDGRLWEHAADPLPRLAAEVFAAVTSQKEPM